MHIPKHIYSFNYHETEEELCKLESRYMFGQEMKDKLLLSDLEADPARSAFIKHRLDVVSYAEDYATLLSDIKAKRICKEAFKVEYVMVEGDTTEYAERLAKIRDIGFSITGFADYYHPTILYALCHYEGIWCFGVLIKNNLEWLKHKQKPCSYSNSISSSIAKALVNIAAKANKEHRLLDVCCGVGTIMLEACFTGNNIEGCDINWKLCNSARANLSHFDYVANIYTSDIHDISERYDTAIIDLPYNWSVPATAEEITHIIESAADITDRLVIVSTSDITSFISHAGFSISDLCSISKQGKTTFARKIWVCERAGMG